MKRFILLIACIAFAITKAQAQNDTIITMLEQQSEDFRIYPNPAQGRVTVEGTGTLTVTNTLGADHPHPRHHRHGNHRPTYGRLVREIGRNHAESRGGVIQTGHTILNLKPSWRRNIRHLSNAKTCLCRLGDSGSSPL